MKKYKIGIFALSRSGHHAIAEWLMQAYSKQYTVRYTVANNQDCISLKPCITKKVKNSEKIIELYCFENYDLEGYQEDFKNVFNLVIIINRDPYNVMASTLQGAITHENDINHGFLDIKNVTQRVQNYRYNKWFSSKTKIELAKQYLNISLDHTEQLNIDVPVFDINYNKWFSCSIYKQIILSELCLNNQDIKVNVTENGGGSSFDKFKYNDTPEKMDVLHRYKKFIDNEQYRNCFDDNIKILTYQYFDMECPF